MRRASQKEAVDIRTYIIADRAYPKKLAYQYLEDLHKEFTRQYGHQIETAARPYAFIKFGRLLLGCEPTYFTNVSVV